MKSVVLEKHDTGNGDKYVSQTIRAFVVHEDSNAGKIESFSVESFSKPEVSINTTLVENSNLQKDESQF